MGILGNIFKEGIKEKDSNFESISISEYRDFFKSLANKFGTTNPDLVYTKIKVYCEKCNVQYDQEALEMLFAVGPGGLFGGARTVVIGETKRGNDLRSGRCPKCGHTRMNIAIQA